MILTNQLGYVSAQINSSRASRRLRKLADWCELILAVLTELHGQGDTFVIDSMPLQMSRRLIADCIKIDPLLDNHSGGKRPALLLVLSGLKLFRELLPTSGGYAPPLGAKTV